MSRIIRTSMLSAALLGGALALAAYPAAAAPAGSPATVTAVGRDPATGSSPGRTASYVARYKAAHDTDPHVPLSAQARKGLAARTETALERTTGPHALTAAASRTLRGTQRAQQTSYWCGPAAVSGALAVRGLSVSQRTSAHLLRTTRAGTGWSGVDARVPAAYQHGHPVADVLSYKLHGQGATYYPVAVAYAPSGAEKSRYRTRLVDDINHGWDLVGDAWEVPGGPHLVGHPGNQEIFHFFTMRGYTHSGAYTRYQDSVHGASSVSWSSGVPAYSTMSSNTITSIVGGRGYIW